LDFALRDVFLAVVRFFVAAFLRGRERAVLAFGRDAALAVFLAAGFALVALVGAAECTANAAPCGSPMIAIVLPPGTSIGGCLTKAPDFVAVATAIFASFTCT
jgi:hypothetical protein